jgi:zinc transport system permease protein
MFLSDFFQALSQHGFLQLALLAGGLVSIPCGVVGSFVVIRRISYMAGGIAHSVLAGLGFVHYLQVVHGVSWLSPMLGAVAAALLAAIIRACGAAVLIPVISTTSFFPCGFSIIAKQ